MKLRAKGKSRGLRLSIQLDQLASPVGGGRFLRGFLAELLAEPDFRGQLEHLNLVATQQEAITALGNLPEWVTVVRRRFPVRWRNSFLAKLFGYLALPGGDVAYGSFYHVFPTRARARVITLHDLSFFNPLFHPDAMARTTADQVARMVHECEGVVCSSQDCLDDFHAHWPHLAHKATLVHCGVAPGEVTVSSQGLPRERVILVVGTLEPRKNYPAILDAFDLLVAEQGPEAPSLMVIGKKGWMSEGVECRLAALQAAGRCQWFQDASDELLAQAYDRAAVFSYLSLSEGFGYPPFEASFAGCPMVLSSASSVGEIWAGHAKCVNPRDLQAIVDGWKWALDLSPEEREVAIAAQLARAQEFTWRRCVEGYLAFWQRLASPEVGPAQRVPPARFQP